MSVEERGGGVVSAGSGIAANRPLSALLSQVLVAFTVELDNEFERRMGESGYPGARLSLVVWANVMRFVGKGPVSVRDLAALAMAPDTQMKFELGCLERWGFVVLQADPANGRHIPLVQHRRVGRELRDGWGSGRGIRAGWIVHLSSKGLQASEIWPPLLEDIEQRWRTRFGSDEIQRLRESLQAVASQLDVELPLGLPGDWLASQTFPPRVTHDASHLPLPALLAQLLLAFRIEFDRESRAPLALCANVLRVLSEKAIRVAEIPRLTGGSPEKTAIGWQVKPYVAVGTDPASSRGKAARLTLPGLEAQRTYKRLVAEIENRWETRFGRDEIGRLRESLRGLFRVRKGTRPLLSLGLVPPEGVVRSGQQAPALGRRDVGPAARGRMRDLVAQTEAFVLDPASALPHYPMWDMNRGFGP
jgi:hypothetical protein